jgi:Na+-translocating ferredoxin:NAD+ oxidoreductase RnfE subunit
MLFSIETVINTVNCLISGIELILFRSLGFLFSLKIYNCMATFRKNFFVRVLKMRFFKMSKVLLEPGST